MGPPERAPCRRAQCRGVLAEHTALFRAQRNVSQPGFGGESEPA